MRLKRVISAALAVSMAVSMMPATAVSAFAAETSTNTAVTTTTVDENAPTFGDCGVEGHEEVKWAFNKETGVLTITGNGPMADYDGIMTDTDVGTDNDLRPWKPYLDQITEVHIAEGVTAIGNSAFRGMKALKKANIPASIRDLGDYIFRYDEVLEEVIWAEGFEAAETTDVDSNQNANQNVYTGKYLPTSMFDFCCELGKGKELTKWLPKSFEGVGCAAVRGTQFTVDFDNWSNLKYIGAYAFSMMPNLESFTLTNNIQIGMRKNASNAFQGSGLKELIVNTEKVPKNFASGCTKLNTLVLGSGVEEVPDSAFAGSAITELDVPASVKKIENWAFVDCKALKKVTIHGETVLNTVPFAGCDIKEFVIENGAKVTCTDNPFRPSGSYSAVTTLESVKIIGTLESSRTDTTTATLWKKMFSPSEQLKEVTVSDANLQYVKAETFPKMENLKVVGDDVTFTASLVGCTNLKTVDLTGCKKITSYANGCFGDGMNDSTVIYVNDTNAIPGSDTGILNSHGIVMVVEGGTVNTDKTGFDSVTKAGCTAKWYEDAKCQTETKDTTPVKGKTYYAKWKVIPVAATMDVTTSKSDYLVNTPVDVNIAIAPGTDMYKILNGSVALTYGDEVEKVELNGKELTEKEYTVQELAQKMELTSRSSNIKATLNVTYKKAGKFDFGVALKDAKGDQICADGTQVVVAEEAAELTPATKLYTLTVKNADVTIKNGDEEIKAEKNDKGELIAKVPEKADVTVTYTSQSDAVAFDQWTITTDETLDVDVKNNPLKFQMPAGGVTIEAMTKDASIEEDEPNILGTAAVLPAGATDTQKAIAWAVENDLLKAAKDNGETYVDTDSVSRVEVIRVWNKAQEK